MSFWVLAAIELGALILGQLLKPKVKRPDPQKLEGWFADEGRPTPQIYGTQALSGNVTWWGNGQVQSFDQGAYYLANMILTICMGQVDELVDLQFGGKSLSLEPISRDQSSSHTATLVVNPALPRNISAGNPATFQISARQLFGGREKEGGLEGQGRFYFGTKTQPIDALSVEAVKNETITGATRRPGVCYLCLGTVATPFYWGTQSQPKELVLIVRRTPHRLLDKGLSAGYTTASIGPNLNWAEMAFDVLTDPDQGANISEDLINVQSFADAAAIFQREGFGGSATLSSPDEVGDILDEICRHADMVLFQHPETGLLTAKVIRADYDPDTVPDLTPSNARDLEREEPNWRQLANIINLTFRKWAGGVFGQVTNEYIGTLFFLLRGLGDFWPSISFQCKGRGISDVSMTIGGTPVTQGTDYTYNASSGIFTIYRNVNTIPLQNGSILVTYKSNPVAMTLKDAVAHDYNLADQQATGEIRPADLDFPFLTQQLDAQIVAARNLKALGLPLEKIKLAANRQGHTIVPGFVFKLTWAAYGWVDKIFRVLNCDYGILTDGKILIQAVEDVWGQDVIARLPGDTGNSIGGTLTAPPVGVACGVDPTDVRLLLFPADTTFDIKVWKANDNIGTGAVEVDTVPGTTAYINVGTDPTKFWAVQAVRIGFNDGPLTPWIQCAINDGETGYVEPLIVEVPSADGVDPAVLGLTLVDPGNTVFKIEFATQLGNGAISIYTEDTAPFSASAALDPTYGTTIYWRAYYILETGGTGQKTGSHHFNPNAPTPPPDPGGTGTKRLYGRLALMAEGQGGMWTGLPAAETSLQLRSHKPMDTTPYNEVRISGTVEDFALPQGAEVVVYSNLDYTKAFDLADAGWAYADGALGPRISVAGNNVAILSDWVRLGPGAIGGSVVFDAKAVGGDGVTPLTLGSLDLEFRFNEAPIITPEPPGGDPGGPTLPFDVIAWYLGYLLGETTVTTPFASQEWAAYSTGYDERHAYTVPPGPGPNPKLADPTMPADHIGHDWNVQAATYNTYAHVSIQVIADGTAPNATGKVLRFKKYSGAQDFTANMCWAQIHGLIPGNVYTVKWRAKLNFDDGTATAEVFCGGSTGPYVATTEGPDFNTYGPEHSFSFTAAETSRTIGMRYDYWYSGTTNPKTIDLAYIHVTGTFSGEVFTAWTDQTGHGHDMPAGEPNPVVGYGGDMTALDLTGGKKCNVPADLTQALRNGGEIFLVAKAAADPGPSELWKLGGSGSTSYFPNGAGHIVDDAGSSVQRDVGDPTLALTTRRLYHVRFTAQEWRARLNGAELLAIASNVIQFATGATVGGGIVAWEMVVTPPLTADKRDILQDRLNCRYALGFPYVTTDPCGATDPAPGGGGSGDGSGGGDGGTGGGDGGNQPPPPPPDTTPVPSGDRSFMFFPGSGTLTFPCLTPWDGMMQSIGTWLTTGGRAANAAAAGQKLFIGTGNKDKFKDASGNFNLNLFQAWLDSFGGSFWTALAAFLTDSNKTLAGWLVADDFGNHGSMENSWGNTKLTAFQIDDMCRRCKQKLPGVMTFIGSLQTTNASAILAYPTKYLDGGYCQYSYNRGEINQWTRDNIALYKSRSWRAVFGLNTHHGGSSTPGVRQPMTPAQILYAGSIIAAQPYLDHFEEWRYDVAEYTAAQIDANRKVRAIFKAAR